MPSKKAGERERVSPFIKTVRITDLFNCAPGYKFGDEVRVHEGADWTDGDLVAAEAFGDVFVIYLYRTSKTAKAFRYYGKMSRDSKRRSMFYEGLKILGPVVGTKAIAAPPSRKAKEKKSYFTTYAVTLRYPYPAFGLYVGDVLTYTANGTAAPGKFIGIKTETESWFARCCLNDERGIYILHGDGERDWLADYEYNSFGLVIEIKRASEVNAEKINALRERLQRLGGDITDSTEAFKIEREIYALEHPKEEDETPDPGDDWPEAIGEGSMTDAAQ
jgi:hypothetical protein